MMRKKKKINDEAKDDVADDGDPSLASQASPVSFLSSEWQETTLSAGRMNQYCPPYHDNDDPIAVAPVVVQEKQPQRQEERQEQQQEPPRNRPDRISITIHYEEEQQHHDDSPEIESTRALGVIWNDQTGVIIGLHHTGILILPNENTIPSILLSKEGKDDSLISSSKSSTTSTFSSLLQIGDKIVRVNGVPWSETVAHEIQSHAARIGSLVFEIETRTSSSSTSGSNTPNENETATMKDHYHSKHENNNATDKDTKSTRRCMMKEYEKSDGCSVDTTISSQNQEHGAKTPSPTSVTLSTPLVEEQNDKKMMMMMIHQAIIILPKTYTGDHGLSLRMGDGPPPQSTMIRTMSDLWKHSVISPNQRILAIGLHHWNTITSCHDGYQYLKQGVQLHQLAVTTLVIPPPQHPASSNWTLRKAVVGITGSAMLGVGAVLFVSPLHPVGHAMVIGGGIVLGTEFEGPKKAMSYSQEKFRSTKNQLLDSFRRRRRHHRRRSQNNPNIQPEEEKEEKQQPSEQQQHVTRP